MSLPTLLHASHAFFPVTTLSAVEPGSKGHNLVLKVVSSNVVVEKTRTDSSRVKIAEALVGDDTGVIVLTARNSTWPLHCTCGTTARLTLVSTLSCACAASATTQTR